MKAISFALYCFVGVILASPVSAWDIHQTLMPMILSGISPELRKNLDVSLPALCAEEDQKMLQGLIPALLLNPKTHVPPTVLKCTLQSKITLHEILSGSSVDDPDQGMDRDLPDAENRLYDLNQDRKWMGGFKGPSSQGFRHMYFGGWTLQHPIASFQVPPGPIGQAPLRAELMATKARELLRAGNRTWGTRLIGWALHYIQDLSQPFHAVQILNLRMVPWSSLFSWPLDQAFGQLTQETTRVITNYHWAYEGYVLERLLEGGKSPFADCLLRAENYAQLEFNPKTQSPADLAHAMAKASIELGPALGAAQLRFFGTELKGPAYDLARNKGKVNSADLAIRPDLTEARQELHRLTCQALAHASIGSRKLLEWTFQP